MRVNDEIKTILLDILRIGLLRVRALAWSGQAEACAVEADHLHDLPGIIDSGHWDLLLSYYEVEKPAFLGQTTSGVDEFISLWDRLDKLIHVKGQNVA